MSIPDQAREPAWAGLEPAGQHLRQVGDAWAKRVLVSVGHPGRLFTRVPGNTRPAPYYHLLPQDGSRALFLKVVRTQDLDTQLAGNRIAEWLASQALPVSPLLESYPRRLNGEYQLLAYRLIDARFAATEKNELFAIGQLLARVHNGLRTLPWADHVQDFSAERDEMFSSLAQSLADRLAPAVAERMIAPRLPQRGGQVIHGDLNIGNLLIGRGSGQAFLLDFEDATHNFHNPLVDLAMALERFVLVRTQDDTQTQQLGAALIRGYRACIREKPLLTTAPTRILQALASRAQLLLANSPASSSTVAESKKFIYLHDLAQRKKSLLDNLWGNLAD